MTKRTKIKLIIVSVVVVGFAAAAVYQFSGGEPYSSDVSELKASFNRDKGKVRLVVLLSPT